MADTRKTPLGFVYQLSRKEKEENLWEQTTPAEAFAIATGQTVAPGQEGHRLVSAKSDWEKNSFFLEMGNGDAFSVAGQPSDFASSRRFWQNTPDIYKKPPAPQWVWGRYGGPALAETIIRSGEENSFVSAVLKEIAEESERMERKIEFVSRFMDPASRALFDPGGRYALHDSEVLENPINHDLKMRLTIADRKLSEYVSVEFSPWKFRSARLIGDTIAAALPLTSSDAPAEMLPLRKKDKEGNEDGFYSPAGNWTETVRLVTLAAGPVQEMKDPKSRAEGGIRAFSNRLCENPCPSPEKAAATTGVFWADKDYILSGAEGPLEVPAVLVLPSSLQHYVEAVYYKQPSETGCRWADTEISGWLKWRYRGFPAGKFHSKTLGCEVYSMPHPAMIEWAKRDPERKGKDAFGMSVWDKNNPMSWLSDSPSEALRSAQFKINPVWFA